MKYSKYISIWLLLLCMPVIGESSLLDFAKKDQESRAKLGERSAWVWRFILQDPSIVEVKVVEVGKEPHVKLMIDGERDRAWLKCRVLVRSVIYANRAALADSRIARALSGKDDGSNYADVLVFLVNGKHPDIILEEGGIYTLALSVDALLPKYMVASNVVDATRLKETVEILKNRKTLDEAWYNASMQHIKEAGK